MAKGICGIATNGILPGKRVVGSRNFRLSPVAHVKSNRATVYLHYQLIAGKGGRNQTAAVITFLKTRRDLIDTLIDKRRVEFTAITNWRLRL
jgi:hypothetical protein